MEALFRGMVLADSVCADNINDAGLGSFEAKAAPASHAGGILDRVVCSAGPLVVGKEEGSAGLVKLMIAGVGAGGMSQLRIE